MAAGAPSPIDCLRALAAGLERGEAPPAAVRARLQAALRRVEEEGAEGLTLDAALGLSRRAWRQEALRRRNATLAEAFDRHLGGSLRQAAKQLQRIARELRSGRRRSATDDLTNMVRDAIATGVPFPSSERQIANILRTRGK